MKKMLIDATSQSEIRLAVIDNNRLENYEFEQRPSKYTKGNVYLAKVIRVEPSLQAAFVEYADNTQGFLPFSEIHPDYFRIPVEDYEALMEEQRELRRASAKEDSDEDDEDREEKAASEATDADESTEEGVEQASDEEVAEKPQGRKKKSDDDGDADTDLDDDGARPVVFTPKIMRRYKIQEVIKHGQLMLVQVTKEERGNKRAALSTYIALAGCYCVLIPNALFNGGVSRKIESTKERKRLKKVLSTVEVPEGMALILRTAAEGKTKASINREVKYLQNFWGDLRQRTMDSVAPKLIHAEGDLINRSLRDIYSKQIEEVHIAGEEAFKQAKAFTKNLNPKLSKSIQEFADDKKSLFESFGLEAELQNLLLPEVVMPSGGALVIEQTEALVSIDVNSGRAISERNIEETAYAINVEAANEIARQLRLRNLAGLVVIDFIDMDRRGNQQKVERVMKAALKNDKARVHVGRISSFGLLEMSRQRLGPSLIEKTSDICPRCQGAGRVLSDEGMASALLRTLRQKMSDQVQADTDEATKTQKIVVSCLPKVAEWLLNAYREELQLLEEQSGMQVVFVLDATLEDPRGYKFDSDSRDRGGKRRERQQERGRKPRRDDKRGKGGEEREKQGGAEGEERSSGGRKRRGGRGRKQSHDAPTDESNSSVPTAVANDTSSEHTGEDTARENTPAVDGGAEGQEKPKSRRSRSRKPRESRQDAATETPTATDAPKAAEEAAPTQEETPTSAPKRTPRAKKAAPVEAPTTAPLAAVAEQPAAPDTPKVRGKPMPEATATIEPKRKGWWNILS